MRTFVHYIPIVTTILTIFFAPVVLRRWREKRPAPHLFWWGLGVAVYGLGTLTESLTTLFGWNEWIFRSWYISGALLGGWPLAQGTVYLMFSRRTATLMALAVGAVVLVASTVVLMAPIDYSLVETHRLTGSVMEWREARLFSPFINTYAAIFLIGGAVVSAWRYRRDPEARHRFIGNCFIAVGALLPGIGGTATRMGYTEVLYVMELLGIILIWIGYRYNVRPGGRGTPRPEIAEPALG
jgi:multisubunit Na+/H+ antiporter MnhB subunit